MIDVKEAFLKSNCRAFVQVELTWQYSMVCVLNRTA